MPLPTDLFTERLCAYRDQVERGLHLLLPPADTRPARLHEAMRYSMEAGGKRLRPVFVLAAADAFGRRDNPIAAAVAIECLHTYSLVHDDLPCMDNDDLRRGRPTVHRKFDEATALLAGDALLTFSFQLLAEAYAPSPTIASELVRELAQAAGSRRLIGGQMEDLLAERSHGTAEGGLRYIHENKTAAMIEAALVMGARCGDAGEADIAALRDAGRNIGLAFQIIDDVLDATADTATLGKTAGKDARAGKATYVSAHGIETARKLAAEHTAGAHANLKAISGDSSFLLALTDRMLARNS